MIAAIITWGFIFNIFLILMAIITPVWITPGYYYWTIALLCMHVASATALTNFITEKTSRRNKHATD